MRLQKTARGGFTLIELLVVIGLILVLVGITVSISYSGLIDSHKTVGAGDRASGWLLIARSKAQREQAPRGVRFIIDPTTQLIKEAQYIEVPDPFVPRTVDPNAQLLVLHNYNSVTMVTTKKVYIYGTAALYAAVLSNVAQGDTLSLPDFGTLNRVENIIPATVNYNGAAVNVLEIVVPIPTLPPMVPLLPDLAAGATSTMIPLPTPTYATTNFAFLRQARPMLGEPILQLTGDNAIDGSLSLAELSTDPSGNYFDVLFAPNGEVLNTTRGKTIFWVRNPTFFPGLTLVSPRVDYEKAGQMGLIVIYTKTGAIATQPVTLPPGDPYAATRDGFNTGL